MPDADLRSLERAWQASGAREDARTWLRARARVEGFYPPAVVLPVPGWLLAVYIRQASDRIYEATQRGRPNWLRFGDPALAREFESFFNDDDVTVEVDPQPGDIENGILRANVTIPQGMGLRPMRTAEFIEIDFTLNPIETADE